MSDVANDMNGPVAGTVRRPARRSVVTFAAVRLVRIVAVMLLGLRWSGVIEAIAFIHPAIKRFVTPPGVEDVYFTTVDGIQLHGWFMPARGRQPGDPPGPVVLHCHGNEGSVDDHASWSDFLNASGISVLLYDYRGFGRSADGGWWITRNDLMHDTQAAMTYLHTRADVDPKRIGVYGVSLGGAFALQLEADDPSIACAATVCTFSSWPSVASDYVPVLGWVLIQSGMSQASNAALLGKRPLLVVHGDHDRIVSYRHAGLIMRAAQDAGVPATLLTVKGADHLNVLPMLRTTEPAIAKFFADHLAAGSVATH